MQPGRGGPLVQDPGEAQGKCPCSRDRRLRLCHSAGSSCGLWMGGSREDSLRRFAQCCLLQRFWICAKSLGRWMGYGRTCEQWEESPGQELRSGFCDLFISIVKKRVDLASLVSVPCCFLGAVTTSRAFQGRVQSWWLLRGWWLHVASFVLWLNEGLGSHQRSPCFCSRQLLGCLWSCTELQGEKKEAAPPMPPQASPALLVFSYWMRGLLSAGHMGSTLTGGASFWESAFFEVFLKRFQRTEVGQSFGGKPEGGNAWEGLWRKVRLLLAWGGQVTHGSVWGSKGPVGCWELKHAAVRRWPNAVK